MGLDPSASKTALLFGCGYPFRADVEVPEEDPGPAAARGSRIHGAIETGVDDALVDDGERGCVAGARAWLARRGVAHRKEIAYAWDGTTGREIGVGRAAYANAPPGTLVKGTVDLVTDDGIYDWKSSENSARKARPQLMTLAVLAGRTNVGAVELREDGTTVDHCNEPIEPWDLDEHAAKLRAAVERVPTSLPVLGSHCTDEYCPLRGRCPAYTEAVAVVVTDDAMVPPVPRSALAPIVDGPSLAFALEAIDLLETWIESKKKEAKAFATAAGGEVRLDDATVWREVSSSRSGVRGKEALELARKLGASLEELEPLTYTTRFSSFKRVRSALK